MLKNIFGGKSWYKSMTGWAALIFFSAEKIVPEIGSSGLLDAGTVASITGWMTTISVILGALGIRKAATSKNVE